MKKVFLFASAMLLVSLTNMTGFASDSKKTNRKPTSFNSDIQIPEFCLTESAVEDTAKAADVCFEIADKLHDELITKAKAKKIDLKSAQLEFSNTQLIGQMALFYLMGGK